MKKIINIKKETPKELRNCTVKVKSKKDFQWEQGCPIITKYDYYTEYDNEGKVIKKIRESESNNVFDYLVYTAPLFGLIIGGWLAFNLLF